LTPLHSAIGPQHVFLVTFVVLLLCAWAGVQLQKRFAARGVDVHEDLGLVLGATLTLLGLIIGFSFAMAINRYDMRKNYEEAEANAIGTEYLRVELMTEPQAPSTKVLLREYVAQRILFYETRDEEQLREINTKTGKLQTQLWTSLRGQAATSPTPITALVLAGMNDVINSQGYTQAAWWNRIPGEAWLLMGLISVLCNLMLGYLTGKLKSGAFLAILPLVVAIAFTLIADIDTPRHGMIRIVPQNLQALEATLR
jgi:hypothetical protein